MTTYQQFLESKRLITPPCGIEPKEPHSILFPFQRDIVKWALRRGRACVFSMCGTGKTLMQLSWAMQIPGNVLILAPLAVTQQTVNDEAPKIGCQIRYCRKQEDVQPGITITNYEMLDNFDPDYFHGVVLDESSILKSLDGATRTKILSAFRNTPYRSAWTATPAPNDHMELGNHSEFVGAMTRTEMLSMFFVHDGGETSKWRLKGHAEKEFWKWVCSWAVMLRKPSDLGYDDDGFNLPPLNVEQVCVEHVNKGGFLFAMEAMTLQERIAARRESVTERVQKCAEIVNATDDIWCIACDRNDEADALEELIVGAVQVHGSEAPEVKAKKLNDFANGKIKRLISKTRILAFGMNFQVCHNAACVGLSDSWESYFQFVRRFWRFGQQCPVRILIITSSAEGRVVSGIKRKEADADKMAEEMVKHMSEINKENIGGMIRTSLQYAVRHDMILPKWLQSESTF